MGRIRTIKPEFPQSESMGKVSRDARLCFIMLWTLADDAGRLRGNSRMLASLLYPYDDDAKTLIDTWLSELSAEKCITKYEIDGASYVQVNQWLEHQKIDRPSESKLPEFGKPSRKLARTREETSRKGREGKGEEGESDKPQSDLPPAISIPLCDGTEYPIDQSQVDDWQGSYPAVNVLQELREMRVWSNANPANRKTKRGVDAFVVRWLGKEQDKGGRIPGQQRAASTEVGAFV
jgi:hypothetical protein